MMTNVRSPHWSLRQIITITLVGVICGAIYFFGVNTLYNITKIAATPLGLSPLVDSFYTGLWFIAAPLCMYFVPVMGAGVIGETIAAVVEMFLGGQWGAATIFYGFIQGLGNEFGFFPHRYQQFSWTSCLLGAFGANLLAFLYMLLTSGYASYHTWMIITIFLVSTASSLLFDGVLVKLITLSFDKTFARVCLETI